MIEWSESHQMIREAVRKFVEAEIKPRIEELEHGDTPPYDVLRKMIKTFGMDEMARSTFAKRIAHEKAIEAGADVVDTAISSMSLGPGHNPTESLVAMLEGTPYTTNLDAERLIAAEAFAKQSAAVAATVEADKAISDKVQHELETRLGDSDARARDLAGRLRDYQASARGCAVSGAADRAAGPPTAPGEPGGDEAIERATAAVLTACGHDASRLQGFQDWWRGVVESRR